MDSSNNRSGLFANTTKTKGLFGSTSSASNPQVTRVQSSSPFSSVQPVFNSMGNQLSSIPPRSEGAGSFSSESKSKGFVKQHQFGGRLSSKAAGSFKSLSADLEEEIIRKLSDDRRRAFDALIEIDRRQKNEVRKTRLEVDMEDDGVYTAEIRKAIDINKDFSKQNLTNLQNLRDLLNSSIKGAHENEINLLAEMELVSMVYFMHFVEDAYSLIYARSVLGQFISANRKQTNWKQQYQEMSWEQKIFEHIKAAEFEEVVNLFNTEYDNYDQDRELYDHFYNTILPIKNYFKEGLKGTYQTYEIVNTFETMRQNAFSLLTAVEHKSVDKHILNSLKLLSGEISIVSPAPLEYLYLHLIFKNGFLEDKDKQDLKVRLMELSQKEKNADQKEIIDFCIKLSLECPYDTFNEIKKSYPLWFSESLVFMWDASGLLHSETFKMSVEKGQEINTKIIEYVEAEYVEYLINKQFKESLQIVEPYLNILDEESLARSLSSLVEFDFDRADPQSFKQYEEIYNRFKSKRNNPQLDHDYETLVELRANYFNEIKNKEEIKRSFYEALKLYNKKKSIKSFNDLVINKLDLAFENSFQPDQLFESSFNEYKEWKELSSPFRLLATYCEILTAIDSCNNIILNDRLKDIYLAKTIE